MIRLFVYKPNKEQTSRIEFRRLDLSINPYLAFSVMLSSDLLAMIILLKIVDKII